MLILSLKVLAVTSLHAVNTFYNTANYSYHTIKLDPDRISKAGIIGSKGAETLLICIAPNHAFRDSKLFIQNGYLPGGDQDTNLSLALNWEAIEVLSCKTIVSGEQDIFGKNDYLSIHTFQVPEVLKAKIWALGYSKKEYRIFGVYSKRYHYDDAMYHLSTGTALVFSISSRPTNYFVHKQFRYDRTKINTIPNPYIEHTCIAQLDTDTLKDILSEESKLGTVADKYDIITTVSTNTLFQKYTDFDLPITSKGIYVIPFWIISTNGTFSMPTMNIGEDKYYVQFCVKANGPTLNDLTNSICLIKVTDAVSPMFETSIYMQDIGGVITISIETGKTIQLGYPINVLGVRSNPTYLVWVAMMRSVTIYSFRSYLYLVVFPLLELAESDKLLAIDPSIDANKTSAMNMDNTLATKCLSAFIDICSNTAPPETYNKARWFRSVVPKLMITKMKELKYIPQVTDERLLGHNVVVFSPYVSLEDEFRLNETQLRMLIIATNNLMNTPHLKINQQITTIPIECAIDHNIMPKTTTKTTCWMLGNVTNVIENVGNLQLHVMVHSFNCPTEFYLPYARTEHDLFPTYFCELATTQFTYSRQEFDYEFSFFSRNKNPVTLQFPTTDNSTITYKDATTAHEEGLLLPSTPIYNMLTQPNMTSTNENKSKSSPAQKKVRYPPGDPSTTYNQLLIVGHTAVRKTNDFLAILTQNKESKLPITSVNALSMMSELATTLLTHDRLYSNKPMVVHKCKDNGVMVYLPVIRNKTLTFSNGINAIILTKSQLYVQLDDLTIVAHQLEQGNQKVQLFNKIWQVNPGYNYLVIYLTTGVTTYNRITKVVEYKQFFTDDEVAGIYKLIYDDKLKYPILGATNGQHINIMKCIKDVLYAQTTDHIDMIQGERQRPETTMR